MPAQNLRTETTETVGATTVYGREGRAVWPDAVAFQESLQNPSLALRDANLAQGRVALNRLGLPLTYTGRFAAVFRIEDALGNRWALRCFTSEGEGERRAARYDNIARHLADLPPALRDCFVPFHYHSDGVRVGKSDYPLLQMGWARGEPLGKWVDAHYNDASALRRLCRSLSRLVGELEAAQVAHGDLQHDNLLISEHGQRVVLVDYDGVWVPALSGLPPGERGHPNYQHPARSDSDFGPRGDRFSVLVLQTALWALACDATLWETFRESNDDALLFSRDDFARPDESPVFSVLRLVAHSDSTLAQLLSALEIACRNYNAPVPFFAAETFGPEEALPVEPVPVTRPAHVASIETGGTPAAAPTVSVVDGHKWWVQATQTNTKNRVRINKTHRRLTWAAILLILWFCTTHIDAAVPAEVKVFLAVYFESMALAVAYYAWPENWGRKEKYQELRAVQDKLGEHKRDIHNLERHLTTLNANAVNKSVVAFVGHALESATVQSLSLSNVIEERDAWVLDRNNIRNLAQVPNLPTAPLTNYGMTGNITENWLSDVAKPLPGEINDALRTRLVALRQDTVKQARADFDAVCKTRRDLQRERERLLAEEAGLTTLAAELKTKASGVGGVTFARFLGHLLGAS